jgi:hypothetical protein
MAVSKLHPLSQQAVAIGDGTHIVLTVVNYLEQNDTLYVDGTAQGPALFYHLTGGTDPYTNADVGAPALVTGFGPVCTVTIGGTAAGSIGKVLVITRHVGNTSLGTGAGQ